MHRKLHRLLPAAPALLLAAAVAGCATSSTGARHVALVAYSTPKAAYAKLIPAFQATSAGRGVTFSTSFGPSGQQSRSVAAGLGADVVAFSLAPDIDRLAKAGLVAGDWSATEPHSGVVSDSVVVFTVRRGNPKHIRTWADLVRPGVKVLTPNPFTSGGARWNLMAAYGAQIKAGATPAEALAYLQRLLRNVAVQDKSAADELNTFAGGEGDVALTYENEAIAAQRKGLSVDYVVPEATILIQTPVAPLKSASSAARAFVSFLFTPAAQRVFAAQGYRPVLPSAASAGRFPAPASLFTIKDLGGWKQVTNTFFDPQKGSVARIESALGVSTASK